MKEEEKLTAMQVHFAAAGVEDEDLDRKQLEERYIFSDPMNDLRGLAWFIAMFSVVTGTISIVNGTSPWQFLAAPTILVCVLFAKISRARSVKRISKLTNEEMIADMDRLREIRREGLP